MATFAIFDMFPLLYDHLQLAESEPTSLYTIALGLSKEAGNTACGSVTEVQGQ